MSITVDDFLILVRRSVAGTLAVVDRLGDDHLDRAPDLPDANTPFQLVTHAFAATEWWCWHVVAGRDSDRDRAAEFVATGSAADLHRRADRLLERLSEIAPELETAATIAAPATPTSPLEADWTPGTAMLHAYEELAQHLGHLEVTADLLLASATGSA